MKLTKQEALRLIENQGPNGAQAILGTIADKYHIVVGQWQAGTLNDQPTEKNWTVLAIRKDTIEFDPNGLGKSCGTLVMDSSGSFNATHGNSAQYDGKDGRVWYWIVD
jgi:hypothetical protein